MFSTLTRIDRQGRPQNSAAASAAEINVLRLKNRGVIVTQMMKDYALEPGVLRTPDDAGYGSMEGSNGRGALWYELLMAQARRHALAVSRLFPVTDGARE